MTQELPRAYFSLVRIFQSRDKLIVNIIDGRKVCASPSDSLVWRNQTLYLIKHAGCGDMPSAYTKFVLPLKSGGGQLK